MAKEPTLRDLPAIFRLGIEKYRNRDTDYLDRTSLSVLTKHGLPITKQNASLYNLGGAAAAVCVIVPMMVFFSCSPQEFVGQPWYWRFSESVAPFLILGGILAATRALPAFSVSLRRNALIGSVWYVALCLIYNLA